MRTYSFPACYQRFLESTLALATAEVKRDRSRREDEDPRIQALATIPAPQIDPGRTGIITILLVESQSNGHPLNGRSEEVIPSTSA